jgi:ribosomal protein S18 acetylase RimI-like enzyme
MPDSPNLIIRTATPGDADDILACLREAFEPYRRAYTPDAFADTTLTLETLEHRFATMIVLVATASSGDLIGTIAASSGNHHEGHLRGMAVHPGFHGRGVAGQLLAVAEDTLRRQGCLRVTLDTTEPLLRAVAFYQKHGYERTGRIRDFFGMPLHELAKDLPAA